MRSSSAPAEVEGPADDPAREALARDLRERAFGVGRPRGPRLIGAEAELLPIAVDTGRRVPILEEGVLSSLPFLRRCAARAGWVEGRTPGGAPLFTVPNGGVLSYEPGGQIELSSPPCASVTELVTALHSVVLPLRCAAEQGGIRLLGLGIDPAGGLEDVPLQLHSERYTRMDGYFGGIGPFGAVMMRQTASLQVNLDWEDDPLDRWRLLNAAAPFLLALFANSPVYLGADTGHRSYRGRVWQGVDPLRTGVRDGGPHAVSGYLEFALAAPLMLRRAGDGGHPAFREWLARGEVDVDDWRVHLTTLFPEVRPRGFAEVRSIDAVPPEWYAAPLVLLAGLTHHRESLRAALEILPAPHPLLLARAAEWGLSDPHLADTARELFEIGLRGAAALGASFVDADALDTAEDFADRFTRRGRSPADDTLDSLRREVRRSA